MTDDTEEDFRTRRWKLPPEAFVIAPDREPAPTDLIDKHTWTELTWLADDVSLRTSEHHGSTLRAASELWGHWINLTLDVQSLLADPTDDALALGSLAVTDELQASSYAVLTGFYRQAIAALRPALEAMVVGASFRAFPDPQGFTSWAEGFQEGRLWWGNLRRRLATVHPYSRFGFDSGLFSNEGLLNFLYARLSGFSHSRPFYTDEDGRRIPTTNVGLWGGSNGPVYEESSVLMWSAYYFGVALSCLLLVGLAEPRLLTLERPTGIAYRDYLAKAVESQAATHPSVPPVLEHLRKR